MNLKHTLLLTLLAAQAAGAATIIVSSTADSGTGTLRAALASAANGDTINFSVSQPATITLTSGELLVTKNLAIAGPGAANLAVNGNHASRVFNFGTSVVAGISGLTITNGFVSGFDGGGGIYNGGASLAVTDCTLSGNSASEGGGIDNEQATLIVSNCTFSGNSATNGNGLGGGVRNIFGRQIIIANSTISGNAAFRGGGICSETGPGGTMTVSTSTISGNSAFRGGGIYNSANGDSVTLTVANCTISGNSATNGYGSGFGGGIDNEANFGGAATVAITNCTLSGNSAGYGGGICNTIDDFETGTVTVAVANSTLSGNSAGEGGGIANEADGGQVALTVAYTTLNGNSAGTGGGIISKSAFGGTATAQITNSTLSGNSAFQGGGIGNFAGTLAIANTTLSGNRATNYGGACFNEVGMLTIASSTLNGNSAGSVGGIYNFGNNGSGGSTILKIGNTILNAGVSGVNVAGASGAFVHSDGCNLSSDDGGHWLYYLTDILNTNPMLGPLQNNGGPTFTHALLPGSPAIDKGTNLTASATDQRGRSRRCVNPAIPSPSGGDGTDIGAFEFIPPALAIARNFGNVVLSWSTNDPGYKAESTAILPNSGNWTIVPGTPLVIGSQYLLGDGPATGHKFYRLRNP